MPINTFKTGMVTSDGSLLEFNRIAKWSTSKVLYFGDHLYHDLVEPNRNQGWRTGVIIKELEREVLIQNESSYREILAKLVAVEKLLRVGQFSVSPQHEKYFTKLLSDRQRLRIALKTPFNKYFGSVFRTHNTATLFAYYLQRFADVYTSKIENFLEYPADYRFFPERTYMPHEFHLGRFLLEKRIFQN